jgi:hypothetical protein
VRLRRRRLRSQGGDRRGDGRQAPAARAVVSSPDITGADGRSGEPPSRATVIARRRALRGPLRRPRRGLSHQVLKGSCFLLQCFPTAVCAVTGFGMRITYV